jgi:hypothetical protein
MQDAILLGAGFDSKPDSWIRAKERFAPAEQLTVYVNAYRFRLYDVTAEDYSVLKHYLGDDDFDQLIKDFVNTARSNHFNVGRYAAHLPAFLNEHKFRSDFAVELATLENAISQLTDPEETTPLTPEHLSGMTPEALMETTLHPRKALQLFAFEYPVNAYFRAVKDEKSPTLPEGQKSYLAVFRHEDVVWRMDLEAMEYELLSALFSGKTIGEALAGIDESAAAKLSEYFSRWMRNGLLAHYEYNGEQHTRIVA